MTIIFIKPSLNKKYLSSVCFILLTINLLYSQPQAISTSFKDSIQNLSFEHLLKIHKTNFYKDSARVEIINSRLLKNLSDSIYTDEQINKIYQRIYFWKAKVNNKPACIYYADLARVVAEKTNNKRSQCLAINISAFSLYGLGEYNLATEKYIEALCIAEENDDSFMQFAIKGNLVQLKIACNDTKGGIALAKGIIDEIKSNSAKNAHLFLPQIYFDLTKACLLEGNIAQGRFYNKLGKESEVENIHLQQISSLGEANIELYEGNFDKAIKILNEIEKKRNKESYAEITATIYLYKAKAYFNKKKYGLTIGELLLLEKLKNKYDFNHLYYQEGYSLLAKSYQAIGEDELSLLYFEQALSIYTKNEKTRIDLIADIAIKYDQKEFEKELQKRDLTSSKLNYERYTSLKEEYNSLHKAKEKSDSTATYAIVFLTVLFISSGLVLLHSKRRNKEKFNAIIKELELKKKNVAIQNQKRTVNKNSSSDIKEETFIQILKGLKKLEGKEYFLKKECSSVGVSKKLKTNTTYLSKAINSHYQMSFNTYINTLRINYVLRRLKNDSRFRSYSIRAISKELGYQSVNTFTKFFKENTGILPSYYIKKLNANKSDNKP